MDKRKNVLFGLLTALNVIFIMYYVVLAVFMRMHYDDISFLWHAQVENLWQYLDWVYYDRSGRMSVYAMNWIVSWITNKIGMYQFWPILYMLFGWLLCWVFARRIPTDLKKWQVFSIVVLIYNLYILTAVDFAVFYWPCAMQYYIMGPALLALLAYATQKELKWYEWLLCGFVLLIVGLGYEYWTPVVLLALFFCGVYYWNNADWKIKETWQTPNVKRIVGFAVVLLALLSFALSAPGMYARVESGADYEGMVHPASIMEAIKAYTNVIATFAFFQCFYLPYYIIVFIVCMFLGQRSVLSLPWDAKQIMVKLTWVYMILNAVAMLPPAWTYSGFGIQRYYTPLILLLIVYIAMMGYLCGQICNEHKKLVYICSICGLCVLSVIMIVNMCIDFPIAKKWSSAIDARKQYVLEQNHNGRTEDLALDPLPEPRTIDVKYTVFKLLGKESYQQTLFYISDVADHPNDYSVYVRKAYHLNFDIVPKKNEHD